MIIVFCFVIIGIVIGVIFSLLFINFDKEWKKLGMSIVGIGTPSIPIISLQNYFEITTINQKAESFLAIYASFLLTFILSMYIVSKIIKDNDENDILRLRDIVLGLKSPINDYFISRKQYIDQKLNICQLEKRECEVKKREETNKKLSQYLQEEQRKIQRLGNKKIKIVLPFEKPIIITRDFVEKLPSYIEDYRRCISSMEKTTEKILAFPECNEATLKSYLLDILTCQHFTTFLTK